MLLKKGGGATKLNHPELEMACVARALYAFHILFAHFQYRLASISL